MLGKKFTDVQGLLALILVAVTCSQSSAQSDDLENAPPGLGSGGSGGTQLSFRSVSLPLMKPLPEIPTPAGGARLNISDNNKALPMDRIYFNFNHFRNALRVIPGAASGQPPRQISISQYTIGFEKKIFCDCHSIEMRVPVTGTYNYQDSTIPGFSVSGQNAGNISLIYKAMPAWADTWSSVVGLGVSLPTGTDIDGRIGDVNYKLENESVLLMPYAGLLVAPNEWAFYHAFIQLDLVANGNPVFATPAGGATATKLGILNEQTVLHLDVSAGHWLYQNPNRNPWYPTLTGIAVLGELHYTATLQDTDQVGGVVDGTLIEFGNIFNRQDILNATVGIHVEFDEYTDLRVGAAFPLTDHPDRDYDAEVAVQLNFRF